MVDTIRNAAQPARLTGGGQARTFIAAILLGIAFLALKIDFFGAMLPANIRTMLTVLGPIGIIIAYWMHGSATGRMRHADTRQRFADNVYFLGFIFTMLSLIMAFLPVAVTQGDVRPQDVYYAFGTALLATAFGLIGRVIITQTGGTSEEIAARVEEDLTRLAAQVALEAQQIVNDLAGARKTLGSQHEAMVKAVLDATGPRIEAVAQSFQNVTEQVSARLNLQAGETEADVEALRGRLAVRTEDLTAAAEQLATARQQMGTAMNGLRLPTEQLGQDLVAVSEASQAAVAAMRVDAQKLSEALAAFGSGSARVAASLQQVEGGALLLGQRLETASNKVETAAGAGADRVDSGLRSVEARLRDADARAALLGAEAQQFRQQMDAAIAGFERAVNGFAASLDRIGAAPSMAPSVGASNGADIAWGPLSGRPEPNEPAAPR